LKSGDYAPGWVELYHAALLEVDYEKLPERVKLAEDAIGVRLQVLAAAGSSDELRTIQDARQNLRVLQREMEAHRTTITHMSVVCIQSSAATTWFLSMLIGVTWK
jgi:hypothetical protein